MVAAGCRGERAGGSAGAEPSGLQGARRKEGGATQGLVRFEAAAAVLGTRRAGGGRGCTGGRGARAGSSNRGTRERERQQGKRRPHNL
jgi:hypothetical protein